MLWIFFGLLAASTVTAISSLWWMGKPLRTGAVLLALCIVSTFGMAKEVAWGVDEVSSDDDGWCLTYEYPDGGRETECRPTEEAAWAWADALDAELEQQYGPREKETSEGIAFGVMFYVALAGAVASYGRAIVLRHRAGGRPSTSDD